MGLLAQVQAAVNTAFAQAGDLVGEIWLTRQVSGAYNATTGEVTQTEIEYLFEGVVDASKKAGTFSANSSGDSGSEVDTESNLVYLKPGAADPEVGDVLRVGETKMRISNVNSVKPDGVNVLLWELVAKI